MKSRVLFCAVAYIILCLAAAAFAQEFSADVVTTSKDGNFTGKLYVMKDKVRMENAQSIMISRMDKSVMWLCLPGQKMYMEQPLDMSTFAASADKMPGEIERQKVGEEEVDGHMCDKYKIDYSYQGKTGSTYVWLTKDSTVPIKSAAADGSWTMEYRNFQLGTQRADLFELPAGYQKLSMDMSNMGNLPVDMGDLGIK